MKTCLRTPNIFTSLRKHAYSSTCIQKILPPKTEKIYIKTKTDIFHTSAQNIDCGYSLELSYRLFNLLLTNSADPDQTPQNAASNQGHHCLQILWTFFSWNRYITSPDSHKLEIRLSQCIDFSTKIYVVDTH